MTSTWKYLIVLDGEVFGTNDKIVAAELSEDEAIFVIELESPTLAQTIYLGEGTAVQELKGLPTEAEEENVSLMNEDENSEEEEELVDVDSLPEEHYFVDEDDVEEETEDRVMNESD